jgi:hypothetical protein
MSISLLKKEHTGICAAGHANNDYQKPNAVLYCGGRFRVCG